MILPQSNKIKWKCFLSEGLTFLSILPRAPISRETIKSLYVIVHLLFLLLNQYPLPPSVYFEWMERRWVLVGSFYGEHSVSHQWAGCGGAGSEGEHYTQPTGGGGPVCGVSARDGSTDASQPGPGGLQQTVCMCVNVVHEWISAYMPVVCVCVCVCKFLFLCFSYWVQILSV